MSFAYGTHGTPIPIPGRGLFFMQPGDLFDRRFPHNQTQKLWDYSIN
jgi:hypothetical protein